MLSKLEYISENSNGDYYIQGIIHSSFIHNVGSKAAEFSGKLSPGLLVVSIAMAKFNKP
jgi:hypothetical protein